MNTTSKAKKFDPLKVILAESNLIEASAGTGKTYSIAVMVLRLLMEKNIPINEILMVTFTKAAVAELEERVRLFVRSAYKASQGETIKDETISQLVADTMATTGQEQVQKILRTAILFLDETAVLTIHSFCQQTLTSFAFETNQLFGAETLQDTSSIIGEEVNQFWRENITTIPTALLSYLMEACLSRENITGVVNEHLNGKCYLGYEPSTLHSLSNSQCDDMLGTIKQFSENETRSLQNLQEYIKNNKQQIISSGGGNIYFNKFIVPHIDSPEELIKTIWEKRATGYVKKAFEAILLPLIAEHKAIVEQRKQQLQKLIIYINCFAISKITSGLQEYKQRNNLLSFDDMIVNLHRALADESNSNFVTALRAKYSAVFIDEFQDTDRLQYEIFEKAFGQECILFYIGDPKQSIYAWRKADIFTYFKASERVAHRYEKNNNFRSSELLIDAMNKFFEPILGFDTFAFGKDRNAIEYIPVESPKPNTKGHLLMNKQPATPISITQLNNKEELSNAVANQVADLFTEGKYTIAKDGIEREVSPTDVGILVRTNKEGQLMKAALAAKGIPAVTINDAKVLKSDEAKYLLYLLEAINIISSANINKALLSPFTGYTIQDILQLDDEQTIGLFRTYKSVWDIDGIYSALMRFVADYNVRTVLLADHAESGERIITNLFQLIELVHKIQNDKRFSAAELIGWMQRGIEGMETEGDQYEQRVESDEESVKIVTIHKSKGLEYKIVIAPFLDFQSNNSKYTYCSFRHPETGNYLSVESNRLTDEQKIWLKDQTEQENRRLLYVAITRAVYKCFIFQNRHYKESTLNTFVRELIEASENNSFKHLINLLPESQGIQYIQKRSWRPPNPSAPIAFELLQKNWSRISYTMLAAKGEIARKPRTGSNPVKYDQFIFNQLTRGAKTGNLIHYLFENIDFANSHSWQYQVTQAIKRFAPRHEAEYTPMLLQLLQHVTSANILVHAERFNLAQIPTVQRLNELEFDFNVPLFTPSYLQSLRNSEISIAVKYFEQTEGIMNGKVDMFFEYNGKYYILDWKSNYLGDEVRYYEPQFLNSVMSESNYHLQYLIYTVAVKKYLQSRLPLFDYEQHFGGVIYLFVRGVRSHSNTGVFVTRPTLQQIQSLEAMVSV